MEFCLDLNKFYHPENLFNISLGVDALLNFPYMMNFTPELSRVITDSHGLLFFLLKFQIKNATYFFLKNTI